MAPFVADEGPARAVGIARGDVCAVAGGRQIGDLTILKPALDDVPLVWIGFADTDVDIAAVVIDGHVAMPRPVMLGPVLDLHAIHAEDVGVLCFITRPVETVHVPPGGRNTAIGVAPG